MKKKKKKAKKEVEGEGAGDDAADDDGGLGTSIFPPTCARDSITDLCLTDLGLKKKKKKSKKDTDDDFAAKLAALDIEKEGEEESAEQEGDMCVQIFPLHSLYFMVY